MEPLYHLAQQLPLYVTTKICSTCGLEKTFDNFPRSNTKDGYDPRCKACRADYHAQYRAKHRPAPKPSKPKKERSVRQKTRQISYETSAGYKYCVACKQEKPIEEFRFIKSKDRLLGRCKDCESAYKKERWHREHVRVTPIIPKATQPGHKVCNTCLQEKPHTEFSHDPAQKDGYTGRCKKCRSERYHALSEEEKERFRQQDKASRIPRLEQRRTYDRKRHDTDEHRARRREQIAQKKATDGAFRDAVRQANIEWRQKNPLYLRESNRRQKIKQKAARSGERIGYKRILERDGYFCYICNKDIDPTIKEGPASLAFDHKIPLHPRKGEPQGTHTSGNIHPAHKICNERKGNRQFENLSVWHRRGVD